MKKTSTPLLLSLSFAISTSIFAASPSSNDLTKREEYQALDDLNEHYNDGDTWGEGNWEFEFTKFDCDFTEKKCWAEAKIDDGEWKLRRVFVIEGIKTMSDVFFDGMHLRTQVYEALDKNIYSTLQDLEASETLLMSSSQTKSLSAQQSKAALDAIDSQCGDTWCEGAEYQFLSFLCNFSNETCTLSYLTRDGDGDEWKSKSATVNGFIGVNDVLILGGTGSRGPNSLGITDELYEALTEKM